MALCDNGVSGLTTALQDLVAKKCEGGSTQWSASVTSLIQQLQLEVELSAVPSAWVMAMTSVGVGAAVLGLLYWVGVPSNDADRVSTNPNKANKRAKAMLAAGKRRWGGLGMSWC